MKKFGYFLNYNKLLYCKNYKKGFEYKNDEKIMS